MATECICFDRFSLVTRTINKFVCVVLARIDICCWSCKSTPKNEPTSESGWWGSYTNAAGKWLNVGCVFISNILWTTKQMTLQVFIMAFLLRSCWHFKSHIYTERRRD